MSKRWGPFPWTSSWDLRVLRGGFIFLVPTGFICLYTTTKSFMFFYTISSSRPAHGWSSGWWVGIFNYFFLFAPLFFIPWTTLFSSSVLPVCCCLWIFHLILIVLLFFRSNWSASRPRRCWTGRVLTAVLRNLALEGGSRRARLTGGLIFWSGEVVF